MYMDWDQVHGVYSLSLEAGHMSQFSWRSWRLSDSPSLIILFTPRLAPTLSDNIPRTFWSNHTSLNPSLMGNPYQDSNSFALQTRVHVS